ncbi:ABC transporter permease subunit [Microcella alkalica]|uniref:Maltose/maltodextrin transport system permease protein n=1 Tax=Microcella alkalica TaxID=355930 RepID=A0A839E869_9MICO|nr:ABC transporter permease subunit [Microcella alkalica]MBA8848839.1 arabinogalactan oligomer/maltooligosaccharide transport system permease protein [Microcella alkalica]
MSNTIPGAQQPLLAPPPAQLSGPRTATRSHAQTVRGLLIKIALLGVVNAIAVFAMFILVMRESWLIFAIAAVVTVIINVIYLRPGWLPAKYLAPGVFFLAVFQIFVVGYSGYIAFTNYGDGHNSTKESAIESIIANSLTRVPDSPTYRLTVVEQFGTFGFLVTDPDGQALLGTPDQPLEEVDAEEDSTGKAVSVGGWTSLGFGDLLANQGVVIDLSVPLSDDPNDGALRTPDGSSAYVYTSDLVYDEASDSFIDTTGGEVYVDGGDGAFVNDAGRELQPGWKIDVGFENFQRAFTNDDIRGPLLSVTLWTFAFAILSVASTFVLGLFLAIVFNAPHMRGKKIYRVIMVLPYAFPGFLSALVFLGLFNQQFGFFNQVLLGGASIPWLTDPWLAKFSILFVNLWLGFPYMFLICTGALQSIPEELSEAATVDGAKPFAVFRLIKFPLLLVSVAPLLISSFAFNFNNFNLIYMLTGGGPRDIEAGVDAGATDILITLVYKVAFGEGTGRDYGLASAFAILIFLIVATVSIVSFRQTKALEELN